jgi:sulfonate transport system substrate-binding protein
MLALTRRMFATGLLAGGLFAALSAIAADRFFKLGLIPKAITVSDAVWAAPTN